MAVRDYSVSAGSNTAINTINIAEGAPAANMNDAIRQMMADVKLRALEVPTLRDVGAVGDGTTNDATAITNAVTTYGKRIFWGDQLTYRITSNLPAGFRMLDGRISDSRTVQPLGDEFSVVALGWDAGKANTFIPEQFSSSSGFWAAGNHLVFIGGQAGAANTTGRRNVFVGSRAGLSNTTGAYLTALGSHAFENNTTGFDSTAVGVQAGQSHTTGSLNNFFGVSAGNKVTSGTKMVAIGNAAGGGIAATACVAVGAISIGFQAGGSLQSGNDQILIGNLAGQSYQSGDNVICIGGSAGLLLITASNVVAIGASALRNSTASANVAVGTSAGQALTTGVNDVFIGHQAGLAAIDADSSVFVGHQAGFAVTTGDQNTLIGKSAGTTITIGTSNVCVGYTANVSAAGAANQNSFGVGATCSADNQITLGNASITALRCQVTTITALSDQRFKTATGQKTAFSSGLGFINDVRVRDFRWKANAGPVLKGRRELGIFAQELDAAATKHGLEWLGLVDKSNPDRIEATPGKLLFPLIQAVQELSAQNDNLSIRLAALEAA